MKGKNIFYYDNDKSKEIKAGGAIFYKYAEDDLYLLLTKTNNKYEDFGGKIDDDDKNIYETISREIEEESNGVFKKDHIMKKLDECNDNVYSKVSKYYIAILPLDEEESQIDVKAFGDKEIHDNFARTVEYVSLTTFLDSSFQSNLNFRLKNYALNNKLRSLNVLR
ncbi:hypothetical protein Catovirus_1_911 [Catovirus CTV1]|uniref:Nudix hydrolase domain-containing protein n=1 Tax=Catovirus CTV1 TaxID=1977631 RepID=A0A1V0SB00_9VIRU|nr:hypothetical protein Catovirus_1_911 [Catovirus CTV1]